MFPTRFNPLALLLLILPATFALSTTTTPQADAPDAASRVIFPFNVADMTIAQCENLGKDMYCKQIPDKGRVCYCDVKGQPQLG